MFTEKFNVPSMPKKSFANEREQCNAQIIDAAEIVKGLEEYAKTMNNDKEKVLVEKLVQDISDKMSAEKEKKAKRIAEREARERSYAQIIDKADVAKAIEEYAKTMKDEKEKAEAMKFAKDMERKSKEEKRK